MASRQRARGPKKERSSNQLADLGIFDIPDFEVGNDEDDSDVDDSALESELEAILSGKPASKPTRPKKKVAPVLDIEKMAAECMKDVDFDDNADDDTPDPELLRELQGLSCESPAEDIVTDISKEEEINVEIPEEKESPSERAGSIVSLIEDRLKLYQDAVAAAKALSDNSKCRRYGRAVKTLETLLKTAKCGGAVNEEDIPPVVSIPKGKGTTCPEREPSQLPPYTPTGNLIDISGDTETPKAEVNVDEKMDDCQRLNVRKDQYRVAALQAKKAGDKGTALQYMKIAKSFDAVIEALNKGEPVDLSCVPPPPPPYEAMTNIAPPPEPKKDYDETQSSSAIEAAALSAASEPEDPMIFSAPPAATTILEALEQRLEKYKSTKTAAEAEGNSSKVRRLTRIINSYEKAIKDHKAFGKTDFEDLPTPPGFAPIPMNVTSQPNIPQELPSKENIPAQPAQKVTEASGAVPPKRPAPQVPSRTTSHQKPKVQRTNTLSSTFDKQLEFLLERQKLFRQAALTSKKEGNISQAKEYLRMSKGFDSMIEATRCGLPIDATCIPTPPQLESNDFILVDASECIEPDDDGNGGNLLETLEKDLIKQIEVCTRNKEHFLRLGDVSSASRFEKLGLESKKDLTVIRHLLKTGQPVPTFHYEMRLFSMVQCHTDLGDNEIEVNIERGINLPGKQDDLDSYVKLEFPIPSEAPQRAKTHTVRDTNNPVFQEEFKFEINRKSRAQLRMFKRGVLLCQVWSKGGFLRSDTLIGTVNVKLVDLESKCTIHDCFDLMDGRKACGGKLEVKVRIRQPLVVKQVEEVREKWLIIGS